MKSTDFLEFIKPGEKQLNLRKKSGLCSYLVIVNLVYK